MRTPEKNLEKRSATVTDTGGRIRVSGALNSILWLTGVVSVPCIGALAWNKDAPPIIAWVLCAVVCTALIGFLWLLFFDRNRLQSEEYLLQSRTLDLIEEKGSKNAIDATTVQSISQTDFLALPEAKKEGDQ